MMGVEARDGDISANCLNTLSFTTKEVGADTFSSPEIRFIWDFTAIVRRKHCNEYLIEIRILDIKSYSVNSFFLLG